MNNVSLVIADADAIIALSSKGDALHERAKRILRQLLTNQADVLFPLTALCEAATAMRRKFNNPAAAAYVMQQVHAGNFPVQIISQETFFLAQTLFDPYASKQHTLFDAIIGATATHLHADAIFSFDRWYKTRGFVLVEDFLIQQKVA